MKQPFEDVVMAFYIKLMKGKALRKHSLHEKTAVQCILVLFRSFTKRFTSFILVSCLVNEMSVNFDTSSLTL